MSDPSERRVPFEQPKYIVLMLLFVVAFSCLQSVVLAGLYFALYGVPTISEWTTIKDPQYSQAALWKDRVWYSIVKIGPNNLSRKATLMSYDPENGKADATESKFNVPFPFTGLIPQGEHLWVVSPDVVTRIEGEQSTEFKTKKRLHRPCEPFLYEDQLAVIDQGKTGSATLLIFQNEDWVDRGAVLIPSSFAVQSTVDGISKLVAVPVPTSGRAPLLDLQVVAHHNRLHLFLSDGVIVAYREGLEMAPVSALAPVNVPNPPDLSDLADWEIACRVSPVRGLPMKTTWKAALVDGEPSIVTPSSSNPNPFQGVSLLAYGRVGGTWRTVAEASTPAMLNLLVASDGQKTYVAGQSLMQTLRFQRLLGTEIRPTGTVLKAPAVAFQKPLERWARLYPWVHWTGLLVMAMGVTRLMTLYCDADYQFGMTTVEMASFVRRTIARGIDYGTFSIFSFILAYAFGFSSQEQVERDMDKIFDMGSDGLRIRLAMMIMSSVALGLAFVIVNSWFQGRSGLTLGKWICGIRMVGTTLRPCGFARALFRELLLLVEVVMGTVFIPVTLLIAFTSQRQRIGDMVADTIVIRRIATPLVAESER